ncbi:MAG: DUF3256 family protein [Candidatus Azobacteroides sp.]|nr:DUF3256 family protein [Candidatus Azobacteroides sp.]
MNKTIMLLISLHVIFELQAQTSEEAFISLPESMAIELNVDARRDLVDLYQAGRKAIVENLLEDSVSIENMTPDYLLLKTGNDNMQIIILQMINESKLYCLIQTVCAPACDSRIEFYSVSWKQLDTNTFITPFPQSDFINANENSSLPDMVFMQYIYSPETSSLQQIDNTFQNLSIEDQKAIQALIKKKVKEYKWNGFRFIGD